MLDCYMLYEPLSKIERERLLSINAIVPENNIDKSLNSFFYLPVGTEIPEHFIHSESFSYLGKVSEEEAKKHFSKYEEVSKIKPKDIIIYDYYRQLPMEVINIEDNIAKCKIKLRSYETSVTIPVSDIKLLSNHLEKDSEPVAYSAIPSFEFEKLIDGHILIDCDSVDNDLNTEYISILLLSLSLKTIYSGYKVVLANPLPKALEMAQDFGLEVAFGHIRHIISHYRNIENSVKIYIYSNKDYLYSSSEFFTTLKTIDYSIFEFDYKSHLQDTYGISMRELSELELNFISNYIEFESVLRNKLFPPQKVSAILERINSNPNFITEAILHKYTIPHDENVSTIDYDNYYKVANHKLTLKLEYLGLTYLSQNIEYYSRIIKS